MLICDGGGATPVAQTPDTDLNEHVRRLYGSKECHLMFKDCLRKAEASRDDGIIAFTKAVYGWLVREHRYEKQRLENKSSTDQGNEK